VLEKGDGRDLQHRDSAQDVPLWSGRATRGSPNRRATFALSKNALWLVAICFLAYTTHPRHSGADIGSSAGLARQIAESSLARCRASVRLTCDAGGEQTAYPAYAHPQNEKTDQVSDASHTTFEVESGSAGYIRLETTSYRLNAQSVSRITPAYSRVREFLATQQVFPAVRDMGTGAA
jgi:hypothetical protein